MILRIGDKVKIKSLDWYNLQLQLQLSKKDIFRKFLIREGEGVINFDTTDVLFAQGMNKFCGKDK